jgi:ribosomal protein S12 methylthiotransferase accessory factor
MPDALFDIASRPYDTERWRRTASPEETLNRLKPLMPVFGITRVANVTGLDTVGIPTVMVLRPNSRALSVSQGKGFTLAAAKASGVMESVESYHAERITLPLKLGSYEDLRYTHALVDVERLPRLASGKFTPFLPLLWVEGRSLATGSGVWVPFEMVHTNYTLPLPTGHGYFQASSNGLSSGNHIVEAIIHGLCEVVERDACALWRLGGEAAQDDTRVDLETVADPVCRDLLARFARAGIEVGVWDATSDVGLPTFACRIVQGGGDHYAANRPAAGFGTHLVKEIALARALTEAAQSRLTHISGARDDLLRDEYEQFLDPAEQARWLNRIRLGSPIRDFNEIAPWHGQSLREDLDEILRRLRAAGLGEAIVVDLTKPEFNIPVVRVIVPGLEGVDHSPDYILGERARAVLAAKEGL